MGGGEGGATGVSAPIVDALPPPEKMNSTYNFLRL